MSKETFYTKPKEMSRMLKTYFRNQSVFAWRAAKQTDDKANILVTLSIYLWVAIIIISFRFDTYLHFPGWLIGIPWILSFLCILECIFILGPNSRFMKRLFSKELFPTYPEPDHHNMFGFFNQSLKDREESLDSMMEDHAMQLGNIVRGHFATAKYINHKYAHLDRGYNYFLAAITIVFILFIVNIIGSAGHFHEHTDRESYVPYIIDEPNDVFVMDEDLQELSGLTFNTDDGLLYAINDEKGRIYRLNANNGKIESSFKFGKKGDYEGIEYYNERILVTNSSGDLFISELHDNRAIIQHPPLSRINDVEGLGIDPETGLLLIACKGEPWLPIRGDKAVYVYDHLYNRMDSTVFLDILISDLKSCVDSIYSDERMKKALIRRLNDYAPSAIAIHPVNNDIYILTAHGSILTVFDKEKKVRDVIHLNEILIPQPEGICFDNNNNLYISTEGHGGPGKIFKFKTIE